MRRPAVRFIGPGAARTAPGSVLPSSAGTSDALPSHTNPTDTLQLSTLVRAWVRRPDAHPDEPAAFAAFLAVKARRPHRSLERVLDWVLWVYRTLWPVLVRVIFCF